MKRVLTLALLALLIPSGTFGALSDTTDSQTGTFTAAADFGSCGDLNLAAVADATVDEENPSTSFGTATELRLYPSAVSQRALVAFDDVAVETGCSLATAILRVYATTIDGGRSIDVWRSAGSWTEVGVTWANQPATAGSAAFLTVTAGWNSVDVTSLVAAQLAGTNDGFILIDPLEDTAGYAEHVFSSREGGFAPQLIVTFSSS